MVDFGAFIDIGLKNDGLLHKSQLGKRVSNVFELLSI
ncbi:MAG: S1 RNA-binding domain-containing protein [Candidatus Peribacteria bacterium]|nr:MAG: S1 RNA-binding domain-containing protein [Candidatus Peribacteria bacterium]